MQDIYIGDEGKGIPLVLVHGFLGSSKMWQPQIDFFSRYFRVITPDLPGFGKSKKVKSFANIKLTAKLLLNCLKKKKITKFYLLGHSMGGMIAQEMAKNFGGRMLKLIFYSTGPVGEMPGRFETVNRSKENLKKKGLRVMTKKIVEKWFVKGKKAKYYNICIKQGEKSSVKAVNNYLVAFQKWNGVNNLKKIKNETLIIWGDCDKSYNIDQIKILKNNIKKSKLVVFKGCSHNVHLEKINRFNRTIKNFLL